MVNLKDHNFPSESFIGGFYINESICDDLINYFKDNRLAAMPGTVGGADGATVKKEVKDSTD